MVTFASAELTLHTLESLWLWEIAMSPFVCGVPMPILGRCCTDHSCTDVARWLVHWPGQDGVKCDAHKQGWERIARAMGFVLQATFIGCADDFEAAERAAVEAMERAERLRR